ncbi:protocatechuate 3,4-dioxygenase subunit beta [Arthrobacter koreensis]|jgi:protocatechuate 3,4-dioxygenase beta subunit|uniref:Protocatechuate 3,4-dioxygenase subunit beta n=1 Tax=Arthrobacter koreensis TaxID=199136 RepID=A0ABY6FQD4_9MICC|nr:protocatechuate 3,4-dioxygenase subunit beta [Arthrobacter koreensis]MDF2497896.1 protocatechuate 3,4-dioxygenase subunit beta [Arthrobacter koreensis]MEB7446367.1 protocatechuate 3,4-dioxygenase subunit beta [Arthrobacter koreensis]UYB35425.1 protocatechuate 3,4-dioxygenase subunit beta [Arthrobacter koreensis]
MDKNTMDTDNGSALAEDLFSDSHVVERLDAAEASQDQISEEIRTIHEAYRKGVEEGAPEETQPRVDFRPYRSSLLRHPTKNLHHTDPETIELWSPAFGHQDVHPLEANLTIQHNGEPLGERIIVRGRVLDGDGRPVRNQLIEVWQANSAGRYIHKRDQHPAPIDPNFTGVGRAITGDDGSYEFLTIKPGPYPWKNHFNAWRPAHIHFSLFGTDFTQRMITQMYFPGDPLFALDPIYQSITDQKARDRLVATYDHNITSHEWATGYNWDIVLTGSNRTWMEEEDAE